MAGKTEQVPSYFVLCLNKRALGTRTWGCSRDVTKACPWGSPCRTGTESQQSRGPFLLKWEARPWPIRPESSRQMGFSRPPGPRFLMQVTPTRIRQWEPSWKMDEALGSDCGECQSALSEGQENEL